MKKIVLSNAQIAEVLGAEPVEFPKYTTQLMNLANQNAGGTRPRVVGQLSEMIQEFPGRTIDEWRDHYLAQRPDAIDQAVEKIWKMIQQLRAALERIDEALVRSWVHDLVITKTFAGLRLQGAILDAVAAELGGDWELAGPEDEARGIDGFINGEPISIKPLTYNFKASLGETLPRRVVFYEKTRGGLVITWEPW